MSDRLHNLLVAIATILVVMLGIWIVGRGNATAVIPQGLSPMSRYAALCLILLESLPALAMLWLGAAGYGYPLRQWLLRELPYGAAAQVGVGLAVLLLLNYLTAWAGLLTPIVAWGVPAVGVALLGVQMVQRSKAQQERDEAPATRRWPWSIVLMGPGAAMLLVAAACPPGTMWRVEAMGYDVLSYHLQIPRQWLAAGGMIALEHNVYGFLPGLLEATYAHLGAMHGSVHDAIYACQLFHASLAIFAAAAIGCAVAQLTTATAGGVAAAAMVSIPWTIITGSLAYNEMAVLALGGAAILVLLDIRSERPGAAAMIGLLVGAATLAKPTAGPMLAVPIGLVLLTRLNHAIRWRQPPAFRKAVIAASVAAAAGCVTLSPWLIRNATWTGHPVFPFATSLLGMGHWDQAVADRWDRGHGLTWREDSRIEALNRQWLFNTGYGAAGGQPTPPEKDNIARFEREYGWPVLWGAMLLAALATVRQLRLRRAVGAMLLVLGVQLGFWLVATHLQSRFLVVTLLPACVVIGLGLGKAQQTMSRRLRWVIPLASAALVGALAITSLSVMWGQTQWLTLDGERVRAAPLTLVDALPLIEQTPLDDLPMGSHVYLVADSSSLLYIDPPITYHSAFDRNPLGDVVRQHEGDPAAITEALRQRGITHVWVHWSELDRLHRTYGFDEAVTETTMRQLGATWRVVRDLGAATLYELRPGATGRGQERRAGDPPL